MRKGKRGKRNAGTSSRKLSNPQEDPSDKGVCRHNSRVCSSVHRIGAAINGYSQTGSIIGEDTRVDGGRNSICTGSSHMAGDTVSGKKGKKIERLRQTHVPFKGIDKP